ERDREDEGRDHARRLAGRSHHRAPRDGTHLGQARAHPRRSFPPTLSASSLAPPRGLPLFARNTPSSVGAWSPQSPKSTPFASTARTMSVSPSPSRRRTATSRVETSGSPNWARKSAM